MCVCLLVSQLFTHLTPPVGVPGFKRVLRSRWDEILIEIYMTDDSATSTADIPASPVDWCARSEVLLDAFGAGE